EILWKVWSAPAFGLPSTGFSKFLWFIGALTALLTAVYMTRMMVMTFWGEERFRTAPESKHQEPDQHHGPVEPHESPRVMTIPLIVLAVLSTVGGFIGVPYALSSFFTQKDVNVLEQTLEPAVASLPGIEHAAIEPSAEPVATQPAEAHATHSLEEVSAERALAGVSVMIALLGIGIGWVVFKKRPLAQKARVLPQKTDAVPGLE